MNAFLEEDVRDVALQAVQEQTRIALGVIDAALDRYRYVKRGAGWFMERGVTDGCRSFEEISLSYNGGKDCLVLLILFLAALANRKELPKAVQSVYIVSKHPFAEVDSFVNESVETYHLDLARYKKPMKEAFKTYLEDKPQVKAIFVGTRRTDPHGELLTHFDFTDHGWPPFMRVHPVIDWHYAEIWMVCPSQLIVSPYAR